MVFLTCWDYEMRNDHPSCRGVSLIETVIAMLILSGAFVAVLNAVSSSRATYLLTSDRAVGLNLAEDLMAEVLQQDYRETGVTLLGLDGTEVLGPGRSQFDDLDDFDGWASTPPRANDGSTLAGLDDYTRSVAVDWVNPLSPEQVSNSDQGVKRVTVTVRRGRRLVAELTAYRSESYMTAGEAQ